MQLCNVVTSSGAVAASVLTCIAYLADGSSIVHDISVAETAPGQRCRQGIVIAVGILVATSMSALVAQSLPLVLILPPMLLQPLLPQPLLMQPLLLQPPCFLPRLRSPCNFYASNILY
jgi:hypothetical protein